VNTNCGSAQYADYSEKDRTPKQFTNEELFFGYIAGTKESFKKHGERLLMRPLKSHNFTIAGTRKGKGTCLIIPNLLNYRGSALVIDPKGENAWVTWKARDKMRQKIHILDPWGEIKRRYGNQMRLKDPSYECPRVTQFNPFSILNPKDQNYSDDLAYLADALIINTGNDPFFDDSARALVQGMIAFLVERFGEAADLNALRVILSKSTEEIAGIAVAAQELGKGSLAARKLARFMKPSKTNDSIISTAQTQTEFLDSPALCSAMAKGSGIFEDLCNPDFGATVYLVLPPDKLQTFGRWLRLMVSIGIRTVSRCDRRLYLPVLFMLDEFGTIGKLSVVEQAFGLMAGLNMSLWAFVQDIAQMKRHYPDSWETFIANSQSLSVFGVMDQSTCEYVSRMLGTQTVERISVATAEARKRDPSFLKMADQVSGRPLETADEIRRYPDHLGILLGNHHPYQFIKIPYYREAFFREKACPIPFIKEDMAFYFKAPEPAPQAAVADPVATLERKPSVVDNFLTWLNPMREVG